MIRLLYCSQAKADIQKSTLEDILRSARKHNAVNEVTGVLTHGGGVFMQVIEGPEQAVLRTYVRILDDKRHTDCRIIHISPIKERLFSSWYMGMVESDPLTFEHIALLRAHRLETVHAEEFQRVIHQFSGMLVDF